MWVAEAAKKIKFFLVARPLRGGGGLRAWPLRKRPLFETLKKNLGTKFVATKLEGEGGKTVIFLRLP